MASTHELLAALRQVGADAAVTDIHHFFPESERGHLSTRLCRLRDHGLCISDLRDGKNYWTLTNKGLKELAAAMQPEPEPQPAPQQDDLDRRLDAALATTTRLIEATAPAPQPKPQPEPEPPQPEPEYEPDSAPEPDPIARELMRAMELEVALDDLRRRLRAPVIPARTERVYRELLALLPPIVRDTLSPITALLGDQNG